MLLWESTSRQPLQGARSFIGLNGYVFVVCVVWVDGRVMRLDRGWVVVWQGG